MDNEYESLNPNILRFSFDQLPRTGSGVGTEWVPSNWNSQLRTVQSYQTGFGQRLDCRRPSPPSSRTPLGAALLDEHKCY